MPSPVFSNFTVRLNFSTGHQLQWRIAQGFVDIPPYNFQVEASSTFDFSEIIYTINAGDSFFAIDDTGIKQNWSRDLLYRVKLTTGSNNIYYSEILSFDSTPTTKRKYRMASDIIRKEALLSSKFAGWQGYLLKRKVYGQIDLSSVDPISGAVLTDNIGGYGVGITGGYFAPVPMVFRKEQSIRGKTQSPDGQGVKESLSVMVRTLGFPFVDSRDVIVNAQTGERYNVADDPSPQGVYFPGTSIQLVQKLSLQLLPTSDTVYQIPVPSYQISQLPLDQQPGV
jgi:hypothetical protein